MKSTLVKDQVAPCGITCGTCDLATRDASLKESVIKDIENAMETGAPSVKSRENRLLGRLSGDN